METSNRTTWVTDPIHSEIGFRVKHLMITNVKGSFKKYDLNVTTDGDQFRNVMIRFSMDPASVDTGEEKRDAHLRSADFFDVENHKEITFTADGPVDLNADTSELDGLLTIRGITNKIRLEVEFEGLMKDPWGNIKAGFVVNGRISRKDWGLNWNAALETGGVLVSDEVRISCEVQLLKQA